MAETRELNARECEALLRHGTAGRAALSTPTGPHIVPVNYFVLDDAIIVRTSPYSMLGTYARDSMLAFEIDHVDPDLERGWSVQARGRVSVITDSATLESLRAAAMPRPLVGGVRSLYLRMRWTELSGRQVGPRWNPLEDLDLAVGS